MTRKRVFFLTLLFLYASVSLLLGQNNRLYIANDNHTDYLWSGDVADYDRVAVNEIDFHLDLIEQTNTLPFSFQNRYNLDGAWYLYSYMQQKSPEEVERLMQHIRSGHISVPMNFMASHYGGQPTEAVLRGMYWQAKVARENDLPMNLASSMENQSQPLGLASLWAGSGIKYAWKGICGCSSPISNDKLKNRTHEVYRYQGLDQSEVLMKWYSFSNADDNERLGGYAEARNRARLIQDAQNKINSSNHPWNIVGAFGYGWDDLETLESGFPQFAEENSSDDLQVYVSNEQDFFEAFESRYARSTLPRESVSYGNDWDLDCAAMASTTATVRNGMAKLRSAEAMASLIHLQDKSVYENLAEQRTQAWIALGSFWEHNFGLGGCCNNGRALWQVDLQEDITSYVDNLYQNALQYLVEGIENPSEHQRFFVFNPLGWQRTDVATFPYEGSEEIVVIDITTGMSIPFQVFDLDGVRSLQVLAENIPPVGYKVFDILPSADGTDLPNAASRNGDVFENDRYRLRLSNGGAILSLIDKKNGDLEYVKETNDRFANDFGQGDRSAGNIRLLYNGPVSAMIECGSGRPLDHISRFTLYRDKDRIDIYNEIQEGFGNDIRSYSFSFDMEDPSLWHEELGAVLRAKHEENGGHYADSDQPIDVSWLSLNHFADLGNANRGITLSNMGAAFMKLGNSSLDFLDESSSQINVLIGGRMARSGPGVANQNGDRNFQNSFSLRTRSNEFDAVASMKFAMEHQHPFITRMIDSKRNALPEVSFSLLSIDDPNVLLWTVKPPEDVSESSNLVIRLWNLDDQQRSAKIDLSPQVLRAQKISHVETPVSELGTELGDLSLSVGGQRMESYALQVEEEFLVSLRKGGRNAFPATVFPNPVIQSATIQLPCLVREVELNVYDLRGRRILQDRFTQVNSQLDLSNLNPGLYIFTFREGKRFSAQNVLIRGDR